MIGVLLGHTQPETTQRDAHLVQDHVRQTNDEVGERISRSLGRSVFSPSSEITRHIECADCSVRLRPESEQPPSIMLCCGFDTRDLIA